MHVLLFMHMIHRMWIVLHVEQLTCICMHQRQHRLRAVPAVADACMHVAAMSLRNALAIAVPC